MTWEDECVSLYYIREEWQTLIIDVVDVKSGMDEEYERKYWDFPILDLDGNKDGCFFRVQSKVFLRDLKKVKATYGDVDNLQITFCKVGKGKDCSYKIQDHSVRDFNQDTIV